MNKTNDNFTVLNLEYNKNIYRNIFVPKKTPDFVKKLNNAKEGKEVRSVLKDKYIDLYVIYSLIVNIQSKKYVKYRKQSLIKLDEECLEFLKRYTCDADANKFKKEVINSLIYNKRYNVVYEYVKERYEKYSALSDEEKKNFNHDDILEDNGLFANIADYLLFKENKFDDALNYYELASFDWNNGKNKCYVSDYEEYKREANGQGILISTPDIKLNGLYNTIKANIMYGDWRLVRNDVSTYIKLINNNLNKDLINNDNKEIELNKRRILLFSAKSLADKYILGDLKIIENEINNREYFNKFNQNIELLNNPTTSLLYKYYIENGRIVYKNLLKLAKLMRLSLEVKDNLLVNKFETYAYYTKLDTFLFMLPCKNERTKEQVGKPAIMNVLYMNDPTEGSILFKILKMDKNKYHKSRKEIDAPNVYMKCFTKNIDYLPMWNMYGDNGEGLCISVDWAKIKRSNPKSLIPLYHVCYVDENSSTNPIKEEFNKDLGKNVKNVSNLVKEIKKTLDSLHNEANEQMLVIINNISYLFKNYSYSYENEVRLIYNDNNIKYTNDKNKKLYVCPRFLFEFSEITLGPKFNIGSDTIVPYLKDQIMKMVEYNETTIPKITVSNINYR